MNIAYHCKFCHRPGVVTAEVTDDFIIAKWLPLLCCNRCGDFMHGKRKIEDAIAQSCRVFETAMYFSRPNAMEAVRVSVREQLIGLTKRFCAKVCDHFKVQNVWDESFVDILMQQTSKCRSAMRVYVNGIAKESPRQEARQPHAD